MDYHFCQFATKLSWPTGIGFSKAVLPHNIGIILATIGISWILFDKLLGIKISDKLKGNFAPIQEERLLNHILAQIGLMTRASRVVLTAFHNGAIDKNGYHMVKVSTINSYVAPGSTPLTKPIRDLPVGVIMYELEKMIKASECGSCWTVTKYSEDLADACRNHLLRNDIGSKYNRLIRIGNLPIGILSIQYSMKDRRNPPVEDETFRDAIEDAYDRICAVMRRRIVHPGSLRRVIIKLTGKLATACYR